MFESIKVFIVLSFYVKILKTDLIIIIIFFFGGWSRPCNLRFTIWLQRVMNVIRKSMFSFPVLGLNLLVLITRHWPADPLADMTAIEFCCLIMRCSGGNYLMKAIWNNGFKMVTISLRRSFSLQEFESGFCKGLLRARLYYLRCSDMFTSIDENSAVKTHITRSKQITSLCLWLFSFKKATRKLRWLAWQ